MPHVPDRPNPEGNRPHGTEMERDTIALYPFDEGTGNEAHGACGDPTLTLRAAAAQWGRDPDGRAVARFGRSEDDATVFLEPVNHAKHNLPTCPDGWTVEAWIRRGAPSSPSAETASPRASTTATSAGPTTTPSKGTPCR